MSKQSGLGDDLMISGYALGCDIGSIGNVGGGPAALDMTGICKSAPERKGGTRDGRCQFVAFFNPATGRSHERLSALPRSDVLVTYHRGTTLGAPAAALVAKQISYDPTRGDDGSLTFAVESQANAYGLEWGRQLTAGVRTDSAATNGSSVDFGTGSTAFGAQLYLHIVAFTGTDATITVQESSDDGAVDTWSGVTGGAFTQITGSTPGWERIQTARDQTVERYLRVVTTTTGGFSDLQFAVIAVRNDVEVVF
ncbi:hypothetical protein D7231_31810 [Streptomyces klenkii]|uniref:Uncharacterized protein n=1 Tax=Streptomyces klenkii TaxID=1420899 RepID=A0A3B0AM87_9ACTN|nr:hypothetical protein [Streptomyces klenkii]RKN61860.1 hypothetical protein D7231_31810 [Streptomyces klenkii]